MQPLGGDTMGQTLSEPVTTKTSAHVSNGSVAVGASSMQGWRVSMEDAHTVLLAIPEDPDASFFGVFDGHGGSGIAEFASIHLPHHIVSQEHYSNGDYVEAVRRGFLEVDQTMRRIEALRAEMAGSTAVTILIKGGKVYCGNAGDSRAIAMIGGVVHPLSQDHKPTNKTELDRIKEAGGFVDMNRVNGNLALSRALGDYSFKANTKKPPEEQQVTANPDVTVKDLTPEWQFILLACDGIWDVLTNEEVGVFVAERLSRGVEPHIICEELMDRCLAPDGHMGGLGLDNMTTILIVFSHDETSQWDDGEPSSSQASIYSQREDETPVAGPSR